jgi:predicted aldo/keto reductase-like oxidoreductase
MEKRRLGQQNKVGVVGLGTEHLKKRPSKEITKIINEAINHKVNYIDLIWSYPYIVKAIGEATKKNREKVFLAAHLGSCYRGDKYVRSRVVKKCKDTFDEVLENLGTNYVDVVNLHYVNNSDWNKIFNPDGVFDLAKDLVAEGKAHSIGLSTHSIEIVKKVAEIPEINSIMHQTSMANHQYSERNNAFQMCAENGKSIVAMKVFAKGKLLQNRRKVKIAGYITGGKPLTTRIPDSITSAKCIHYSLSQPGVATVVPGVSSFEELKDCINYVNASEKERNYEYELEELFQNKIID